MFFYSQNLQEKDLIIINKFSIIRLYIYNYL